MSEAFSVSRLVSDATVKIVICCGAGGVGKTTTAASIAIEAGRVGRSVCLITIDPAKRLAQLLDVAELSNMPKEVLKPELKITGSLQAMMLDMKGTFDDLVTSAVDAKTAQQILENPFYVALSTSFSGTQEYMAMEKLAQLHQTGKYDLIVVDTPPSRSTLDFLDAPQRLGGFLNGSFVRVLTAPARIGGKLFTRALNTTAGVASGLLDKILGADFLRDVSAFITNFDEVFGGFQQRAERTYSLLQNPATAFVLVATASPEAMNEARFFVKRLKEDRMSIAGLIINRTRQLDSTLESGALEGALERAARDRVYETDELVANLSEKLLRRAGIYQLIEQEQQRLISEFETLEPQVPTLRVPDFSEEMPLLVDLESG